MGRVIFPRLDFAQRLRSWERVDLDPALEQARPPVLVVEGEEPLEGFVGHQRRNVHPAPFVGGGEGGIACKSTCLQTK